MSAGLIFFVLLPAFSQVITPSSNIIYVKKEATGNGSGSSWANAVPELADALRWARQNLSGGTWNSANPLQIWVAKGTYKPLYSHDDDADINSPPVLNSFVLVKDVQVYGGFEGNEATLAARTNWKASPAILSGELDEPYEEGGDTYTGVCHIVVAAGEAGNAVLDGFTVTGGKAEYEGYFDVNGKLTEGMSGGGIYMIESYASLRNLIVTDNRADYSGGGIYIESKTSNTTQMKLTNVLVMGNHAENFGGGVHMYEVRLATHNCILMGNVAVRGGAFYTEFSNLSLVNTVIAGNFGNAVSYYAGGIYLKSSTLGMINTTMSANKGGQIYTGEGGSITAVKNSIINSHNVAISGLTESVITNSIVQFVTTSGGSGGTNLAGTTNPQFVNGRTYNDAPFTNGDYRLKTNSLVLDKGANASYTGNLSSDTDPAGKPRLAGVNIDMGAYEGGYDPLPVSLISFEVVGEQDAAHLKWVTARETNASHFELLRSADGRDFHAIGTVQATGESLKPVHYRFSDYRPEQSGAISYYRIRTVDRDGTYELSAIASIKWARRDGAAGFAYPNPVRGGKVILNLDTAVGKSDIVVFDMSGRMVKVPATKKANGSYELETGGLPAGLYLVKVRGEGPDVVVSRLLVE